jgi:hypothetical protein
VLADVLNAIYHALAKADPILAEEFRKNPFGLRKGAA